MDDIATLYREKLQIEKKEEIKEKVKKVKKKDIQKFNLGDLQKYYYKYFLYEGIKIYNGLTSDKENEMNKRISVLQKICKTSPFTELVSSVLSVQGNFENVLFNEELAMPFNRIPGKEFESIVKIGCNFGEIYAFPNIYAPHTMDGMITSIYRLDGKGICIGCACQNPLDTDNVLRLLKELDVFKKTVIKDNKTSEDVFRNYFEPENLEKNGIAKTRIKKLIKSFDAMLYFKVTDKETVSELYSAIDIVVDKDDTSLCNKYMDMLTEIITKFTNYARACKCWKKNQYTTIFAPSKKRTRKEKAGKKSKRKRQGTGIYFSSQITFEIYNHINKKKSKLKLFRNGNFQVPGVKSPNMDDLIGPLYTLRDYWNATNPDNQTGISYILSNMRNYKCRLANENLTILLNRLEDSLHNEKELPLFPEDPIAKLNELQSHGISDKMCEAIFQYVNYSLFTISEINNNSERNPGLLVKFNRPIPNKSNKKITIKILSSGKINFDGGNSELEVFELLHWLKYIFIKYWDEIIYDPSKHSYEVNSEDTEQYESIYDSE